MLLSTTETALFALTAFLVAGALVWFVFLGTRGAASRRPGWLAGWLLLLLAAVALLVLLVERSVVAGYIANTNMYESLLTLALGLLAGLLVWTRKYRPLVSFAVVGLLLVLGALGLASTLSQSIEPLQPALRSYWRAIHVPVVLLSYAFFFLNFVATLLHQWFVRFQPDEDKASQSAELAFECATAGFPLLTVGVVLGAIWANEAWGTYWNWDPKESMALATLLGYGAYLHLKLTTDTSQTVLDAVAVGSVVLLLITYFGVNLMGVGLHSYGQFG